MFGVTALPPESGSFSSCRRSLTRAQPGPGRNIPCPVHVGVDHAMNGADHGLLLRAFASAPAAMAADARPGRVHQRPRGFVVEVAAAIAYHAPFPRQSVPDPATVARSRPGTCLTALQVRDNLSRCSQEP